MRFDPDSASQFDMAEVQHDLTGDRSRPYGQCDATCTIDCGYCMGSGVSLGAPSWARARDVVYVNDTARQVRPLGLDRPDPATSLAWVVALLFIIIITAALGLAETVLQIAWHWRGAAELATLGYWAWRAARWVR